MLIEFLTALTTTFSAHASENTWIFDTGTDDMVFCFADNALYESAHPIFINSSPASLFYQLPLDDKSQKLIHELVKTIAEKNIWGLLFKKEKLEKIGKKINDQVHPMRFISYILGDPKLKKCLREIKNSSFKWDHFIDGFANRMKEEAARNNLVPYIPGMAQHLNADQEHILSYIRTKDYVGLVKSLM